MKAFQIKINTLKNHVLNTTSVIETITTQTTRIYPTLYELCAKFHDENDEVGETEISKYIEKFKENVHSQCEIHINLIQKSKKTFLEASLHLIKSTQSNSWRYKYILYRIMQDFRVFKSNYEKYRQCLELSNKGMNELRKFESSLTQKFSGIHRELDNEIAQAQRRVQQQRQPDNDPKSVQEVKPPSTGISMLTNQSDSDKEKSTSTSEEDAKILDQPKVNSTELNATLRPATKKSSAGPNSFHGSTSTPAYASYKYQPTSNVITLLAKLFC